MPYYIKKDKEDDERPKRKPLRRTPLKRVSDKRMAELKAGKSKPVTSVKKASKPKSRKKSTLIRELDKVFSLYVRMRDSKEFGFKYFRCISCGQVKSFDQGDAGHFYSRTRMSVRFNENNVHCECRSCNRFSADHLIGYRENLIHKIGKQSFDMLTVEANMSRQWHEFELEQMIKYYKARTQQLVEEEKTDNAALFSKNKFGKN